MQTILSVVKYFQYSFSQNISNILFQKYYNKFFILLSWPFVKIDCGAAHTADALSDHPTPGVGLLI